MTISDLPVGAKVLFGRYAVEDEIPHRICWVKCNIENTMITEFIEDYRAFDAKEVNYPSGNPFYSVSNIDQWLNSRDEFWFAHAHPNDTPPDPLHIQMDTVSTAYENHTGFLYLFKDWEISRLKLKEALNRGELFERKVLLPLHSDIPELYAKGIDSKSCSLFSKNKNKTQLYWVLDENEEGSAVRRVNNTGRGLYDDYPYYGDIGVRPEIQLEPDTIVSGTPTIDGYYEVIEHSSDSGDFDIFDFI